ncbi:hypothetical protein B0H19DRAFT_947317, partial [Mycena capillaripes]
RSIHLLPKFGPVAPQDWKSSNVLEKCKLFFANPLTDRHVYHSALALQFQIVYESSFKLHEIWQYYPGAFYIVLN